MTNKLFNVCIASEETEVDGYCVLCADCIAARRKEGRTDYPLSDEARVLLDVCERSTDDLDVCEDCNYPAREDAA